MNNCELKEIFLPGQMLITPNALKTLEMADLLVGLLRHFGGDWEACSHEDICESGQKPKGDYFFFSEYYDRNQNAFWLLTEADHSVTKVHLRRDLEEETRRI
jgi:hypothetical protein